MAGGETRLLVLGAVRLFEPVNGYQIRRELMSWRVDEWAHTNPGSVYSALGTLTRQGLLERHDVVDGTREVAVYTTTQHGRAELARMFGEAVETVEMMDVVPFNTAMSMATMFPRDTVEQHLAVREQSLVDHLAELQERRAAAVQVAPPHVARMAELGVVTVSAELDWLRTLLRDVRDGALTFAGEQGEWQPPDDDPGWQMHADRARYRRLLGAS